MSETINLTGIYFAEGQHRVNGHEFVATVTIVKVDEVYHVQWQSGANFWGGIGILRDSFLSVAILSPGGNGIIVYEVVRDDTGYRLLGQWAYQGETLISTENLHQSRVHLASQAQDPASPEGRKRDPSED